MKIFKNLIILRLLTKKALHVFQARFLKKKKQKTYEDWSNRTKETNPIISFIVQHHNKSKSVITIVRKLREFENSEIIVIDDGSSIDHLKTLSNFLKKGNEFIIRSNDLYEILMYNRAINMAKGEYIALLQDDDSFDSCKWVDEAISYFKKFDKLVILGGRNGLNLLDYEKTEDGIRGEYIINNNIGQRENSFKFELVDLKNNSFVFAQTVNRAPMLINRKLFKEKLVSIDESYGPFQWDDAELCLRAYSVGLQVGYYDAKFVTGALGTGGMRLWNNNLHHRQDEQNASKLYFKYGKDLDKIQSIVNNLNESFL